MANNSLESGSAHTLCLEKRKDCRITGVVNVLEFDENRILMETVDGTLELKGAGLHVGRVNLEKGEADVDGRVDSLSYSDKKTLSRKGEGLLARLFS